MWFFKYILDSQLWNYKNRKMYITPGPSRDQQLWNEPAKPITNSNKWIVVHVNWPKWKTYDKGFFNWIKIADFHKVIDCFLELFRISLQKTINYFIKICNFDPIKKALVIWFSFGPFYMHNHLFVWIYHKVQQVHFKVTDPY